MSKITPRQIAYFAAGSAVVWLLYLSRSAMTPFLLAAGFAYILNPLVQLLTQRVKLPRTFSVSLIYIALIALLTTVVLVVGGNLTQESQEFSREARTLVIQTNEQISALPGWLQPVATEAFDSARASLTFSNRRMGTFLPGALNRTLSVLVFLVASFYFLKDGQNFLRSFLNLLPKNISAEVTIVLDKINRVLGNYLRGQLVLVVIMSTLTYVGLSIIGVKYALIISVFTGFAEIIPYIGPVAAGAVAMFVAYTDQISRLNLEPMMELLVVALLYFVLRQLEDLFVIPQVMGRMTKLHPLLVMFAVLAGGHLFGVVGFVVAVPIVASIRVILDHLLSVAERK